jgi:DNA-binding NarL/FixJ family response regulator
MRAHKIRVFILMRNLLFRRGIERALSPARDIEVSPACDVNEVVSSTVIGANEVAIVDFDAGGDLNLVIARQLKNYLPDIGIIALTTNDTESQLFQVMKGQAAACLNKDVTADDLVDTIRRVAHGERPINESLITHPGLADRVFRQFQELIRHNETGFMVTHLTSREKEILKYIARGFMNKQIALECGISEQTIKNHVTSIMHKLKASARTEAVDVARKNGLITVG